MRESGLANDFMHVACTSAILLCGGVEFKIILNCLNYHNLDPFSLIKIEREKLLFPKISLPIAFGTVISPCLKIAIFNRLEYKYQCRKIAIWKDISRQAFFASSAHEIVIKCGYDTSIAI